MDSKAVVLRAIQKHTDGLPENVEVMKSHDLYKEQAFDILMQIVQDTKALEGLALYDTDEGVVLRTGGKPLLIDGNVEIADGGDILMYSGTSDRLREVK